jgi:segregation and condensation protein B
MSDDPTASPAPCAGLSREADQRRGEAAANAAEPQPETDSATVFQEALSPWEEVRSSMEEARSPTAEAQTPKNGARSLVDEIQSPTEAAQSLEEAAQSAAEGPPEALTAEQSEPQPEAVAGNQPVAEVEPSMGPADAASDGSARIPAEVSVPVETPALAATAPDEDSLRLAEALVFASASPVSARALSQLLPDTMDADAVIAALRDRYAGRGVELVETGGGIQFRTAPDLAPRLRKVIEVPRKLPRVAMETLAIIAYHQPCTRAEIEEIRGTSLSQQTLDALLEANLVAPKGRREVPGRPTLWGTTPQFLAQFGLKDIRDLPQRGDLLLEPPKPSGVSDAPPLAADLSEPSADAAPATPTEETDGAALSQG